jgi:WD40 repeat protein
MARQGQFSPDGETISFYIGVDDPRVETWSISERRRLSVRELHIKDACHQSDLSSDGRFFVCVTRELVANGLNFTLLVFDVESGNEVFRRPNIAKAYGMEAFIFEVRVLTASEGQATPVLWMNFSPDNRYLVAGNGMNSLAYDLVRQAVVSLPNVLNQKVGNGFVFLAPDRIAVRKDTYSHSAQI